MDRKHHQWFKKDNANIITFLTQALTIENNCKNDVIERLLYHYSKFVKRSPNNYLPEQIKEIRKLLSGIKLTSQSYDFIINGNLKGLDDSYIIHLYKSGILHDIPIEEFNLEILRAATQLGDDKTISKLVKLLPGNGKYNFTFSKK